MDQEWELLLQSNLMDQRTATHIIKYLINEDEIKDLIEFMTIIKSIFIYIYN